MTFTQLGMKHTCCEFHKHVPKEHEVITQMILEGRYHLIDFLEPDEIIEVQTEDKYSAMLLDSLMEEFSAQLGKADMSLLDFLDYWWKRMQNVDGILLNPTHDDLASIRAVGVVIKDQ